MSKQETRKRRPFSTEHKAGVVRLCQPEGKTPRRVVRELGLSPSAVRHWVRPATVDAEKAAPGP
ncbi:transposase [Myxococcota bacterium]